MKIQRTKNAKNNIIFGMMLKIYQLAIPFVMRTVIIHYLGVQYLGLDSLFSSILRVLNLAELGVGSAMVFSMYKPIAEDDSTTICALMRLYKLYYRIIGIIVAVIGLIMLPFIPKLISGDVPDNVNVYYLYLLHLGTAVISYWLFAYKTSLLTAHQRTDIISKVYIATNSVQYLIQFIVLFAWGNYYYYVIAYLFTQVSTNVVAAIIVNKMFPNYHAQGKLPKDEVQKINKRVKDLFTAKLGGIIVTSVDSVVISAFLGLSTLAVYNNYYYILTAIIGFVTIIFNSCTAGIGNSIVVESREKNYGDLRLFTFIISWIAGFCGCCLMCLFQPFMKIWVGEDLMFNTSAVVFFVMYYYIYEINQLLNLYKDAAGMWHEDRFRPLVTAIVNVVLNLLLVKFWGVYGVLLSTVISMLLVGMPWIIHNLFTVLFKTGLKMYVIELLKYALVSLVVIATVYFTCTFVNVNGIIGLVIKLIICIVMANGMFFVFYRRKNEFSKMKQLLSKMLGSRNVKKD